MRTLEAEEDAEDDIPNNAFFSLERRASIFAWIGDKGHEMFQDEDAPEEYQYTFDETFKRALVNPDKYMPKLVELTHNLDTFPGKHLVYSNFVQMGCNVLGEYLSHLGWTNITDVLSGKQPNPGNYKCYAYWDGSTKDAEKDAIKALSNSVANLDGRLLKVVIGSPAIKEGVSFKHVQHYHILDPIWNQSTKTQVEGRAIRFCSHFDIPSDHPFLKRHVTVHLYKISYPLPTDPIDRHAVVNDPKMHYQRSVDTHIYDFVIPKKYQSVRRAEALLRKVAFDYYLFRRLYKDHVSSVPTSSKSSRYELSDGDPLNVYKPKGKDNKNTCMPKKRRPPCKDGSEKRKNKYGEDCCYKIR